MNFCPNCGAKLNPGVKFCSECGFKLVGGVTIEQGIRKGFEGLEGFASSATRYIRNQVNKVMEATTEIPQTNINDDPPSEEPVKGTPITTCPYCGSPLDSFAGFCPGCQREIVQNVYATACQQLCAKLERIERERPKETVMSTITGLLDRTSNARLKPTDQRKVEAIANFVVPNTKADILEFLMLAESKMSLSFYSNDDYEKLVMLRLYDTWKTKYEQVYNKATIILARDPDFIRIREKKEKEERINRLKSSGLCQHCGGRFKGVFNKVCINCGRPKDYE